MTRRIFKCCSYFSILLLMISGLNCSESKKESLKLASIKISSTSINLGVDETETLVVTGTLTDGTSKVYTSNVVWKVVDTDVATVVGGVVTGISVGSTTVKCSVDGITKIIDISVTKGALLSITVTPSFGSIPAGLTQQFTATGTYADTSTSDITANVVWTSSNETKATINNSIGFEGLATGLSVGSSTITATLGSISGSTNFTVTDVELLSIEVTPANGLMADDTTRQFTAMGTYSDSSTQDITAFVTWESSDELVATVNNELGFEGLVSSLSLGVTTITADINDTIFGSTTITVSAASLLSITVTPTNPTIIDGYSQQFIATGHYDDLSTQVVTDLVTWTSSSLGVATINPNGLATSESDGSSTITATIGLISGNTSLTVDPAELVSISVTPANPSIKRGITQPFTAIGTYSDGSTLDITTSVTWASSNELFAAIRNDLGFEGLATALTPNVSPTISATLGLISGSTTLNIENISLVSIEVTPATPSIANGTSIQFTATGTFDDASTQDLTELVTWESEDLMYATISNTPGSIGLATSVDEGSATISATIGSIFGNTVLTITAATLDTIEVTPATPSIFNGNQQQFVATGTFSDLTTQDITADVVWSSDELGIATISNSLETKGLATSVSEGSATITATFGLISGETTLTVSAPELISIEVIPANPSIDVGETLQFTATGTYSDSSTQDITTLVTWDSDEMGIATISNTGGSEGLATGVAIGSSTISATSGLIVGETILTVARALDYVTITPSTPTLKKSTNRQLTGTAYYTDGSTANVTANINRWTSSNSNKIKVNQLGTPGLIRALRKSGSSTITFTYTENGITKNATLVVTAIP